MIVECPDCKKTFNVQDQLIPSEGRLLQCGSCNNKWFFKPKIEENIKIYKTENDKEIISDINQDDHQYKKKTISNIANDNEEENILNDNKEDDNVPTNIKNKNYFKLFLVLIISIISLIIILDTFKSKISNIYPDIEFILTNLYETLKDISLFIKDLIS